jgi:hypothetical protein
MSYKGTHYKEQVVIGLVIAVIAFLIYGGLKMLALLY